MKSKFLLTIFGTVLGGITAYTLMRKNEELKNRIVILQEKVKDTELSNKIKSSLEEILLKLNKLTAEKVSSQPVKNVDIDREKVLREVEEKIEQLEELLKKEQ